VWFKTFLFIAKGIKDQLSSKNAVRELVGRRGVRSGDKEEEKKEEKKEEEKKEEKKEDKEKEEETEEEKDAVRKIEGTVIRRLMYWGVAARKRPRMMEGLTFLVTHGTLTERELELILNREKRKAQAAKQKNQSSDLPALALLALVIIGLGGAGYGVYWGVSTACSALIEFVRNLF